MIFRPMETEKTVELSETPHNGPYRAEETDLAVGVHAVLKEESGLIMTFSAKTRTELSKILSQRPKAQVLAVYKGKKLSVQEKKSFTFS